MPNQRIFILWTNPLFQKSVDLLLRHPQVEIVGSSCNYDAALKEIALLCPTTVLVEEKEDKLLTQALNLLGATNWGLQIFSLNLTDNTLNIYRREQWIVGQADDLLRLVLINTTSEGE